MVYEQEPFLDVLRKIASPANATVLVSLMAIALGFLAIFLLHSITIWLSTDPENAFHTARMVASGMSTVWNSGQTLAAIGLKIGTAWVPGWNTMAKHMIEPGVNIAIDIMSQVFAHKHFEGLIENSYGPGGIPFRGHYCGYPNYNERGDFIGTGLIDDKTSKFCSFKNSLWAQELGATESTDGSNAIENNTLILSTAHARKLQALTGEPTGEGESMFPAISLGPLISAIQELAGIYTMLQTTIYDISAHVAYIVLSELAMIMFNIAQVVFRALASVIMSLIASGALTQLIRQGIDLLLSLLLNVGLPLLFAGLDIVMCLVNMIQPDTWADQLNCVEQTCFREDGDIGTQNAQLGICKSMHTQLTFFSCAISQVLKSLQRFLAFRLWPSKSANPSRPSSTRRPDATLEKRRKAQPPLPTLEATPTPLPERQRAPLAFLARCDSFE